MKTKPFFNYLSSVQHINYWYVALFFHLVICFSFAFVPNPYDKVIGIYILMSITISLQLEYLGSVNSLF